MIEPVILDGDDIMRSNCTPLRQPQSPVLECLQHCHDILDNGPFILYCEESPEITVLWILEPLECKVSQLVDLLMQLQCQIPMCLHIHTR